MVVCLGAVGRIGGGGLSANDSGAAGETPPRYLALHCHRDSIALRHSALIASRRSPSSFLLAPHVANVILRRCLLASVLHAFVVVTCGSGVPICSTLPPSPSCTTTTPPSPSCTHMHMPPLPTTTTLHLLTHCPPHYHYHSRMCHPSCLPHPLPFHPSPLTHLTALYSALPSIHTPPPHTTLHPPHCLLFSPSTMAMCLPHYLMKMICPLSPLPARARRRKGQEVALFLFTPCAMSR